MGKSIDITGQKFGKLTAIKKVKNKGQKIFFLFRCDCGNEKEICKNTVVNGYTKSCGCICKQNHTAIAGQKFNYLTAIKYIGYGESKKDLLWLFRCDCGNEKAIGINQVRRGSTKSCGCMTGELIRDSRLKDLKGKRFNHLVAIKFVRTTKRRTLWLFRCDCGNEKVMQIGAITQGKVQTCGCWHKSTLNPNFKFGRFKNKQGYVLIRLPKKINSNRYILEHRSVMESHIGRKLFENETIHHKNGIRDDNRIENLELWSGNHQPGQRAEDLVKFAREILKTYGDLFPE